MAERIALGQPLHLSWTMTNTSGVSLRVPTDVSTEALFATISVTDAEGRERPVRPFAIVCDHAKVGELESGKSISASTMLFWSTEGFAFERPGRYHVDVAVSWSARGVPVGVQGGVDVFVDYPISDADNHAAGLVMHPEVGKWVALGGKAYHLGEACRRLHALGETSSAAGDRASRALSSSTDGITGPRALDGFAGLLPDPEKVAKLFPELSDSTSARSVPGSARPASPVRAKRARKKPRR